MPKASNACAISLLFSLFALGCGHPASEEECRALFDKSVEVEMREYVGANNEVITKKQGELSKEFEADLGRCVGKRVTQSNIDCIRKASTKAQLNDCRWSIF